MVKKLREGFTTGTAAAAAAKAALLRLLNGTSPSGIDTPLPPGGSLFINVESVTVQGATATATVIKDAGDDPDITHGKAIVAQVKLLPEIKKIVVTGGRGVGQVTLPGLPVPPGRPAINPAPMAQIIKSAHQALATASQPLGTHIIIEVPAGEILARKTMNPRLGITGGISILGTRGTVKPFSHAAYAASIEQALDVAKAKGLDTLGLSTGGRTEAMLRKDLPHLPVYGFVLFADFFSLVLKQAAARGFIHLHIGCYFGKLVKMAQGHAYTHAKKNRIDFTALAQLLGEDTLGPLQIRAVEQANTARQVLELILQSSQKEDMLAKVINKALLAARYFAGKSPKITLHLYGYEGQTLFCQTWCE